MTMDYETSQLTTNSPNKIISLNHTFNEPDASNNLCDNGADNYKSQPNALSEAMYVVQNRSISQPVAVDFTPVAVYSTNELKDTVTKVPIVQELSMLGDATISPTSISFVSTLVGSDNDEEVDKFIIDNTSTGYMENKFMDTGSILSKLPSNEEQQIDQDDCLGQLSRSNVSTLLAGVEVLEEEDDTKTAVIDLDTETLDMITPELATPFVQEEMHWSFQASLSSLSTSQCIQSSSQPLPSLSLSSTSPVVSARKLRKVQSSQSPRVSHTDLHNLHMELQQCLREITAERHLRQEADLDLQQTRGEVEASEGRLRETRGRLADATNRLGYLEAELAEVRSQVVKEMGLREELGRLRTKLVDYQETKSRLNHLETENNNLCQERQQLRRQLQSMQSLQDSLNTFNEVEKELIALKVTLDETNEKIHHLGKERDDAVKGMDQAREQCRELQREMADRRERGPLSPQGESMSLVMETKVMELEQQLAYVKNTCVPKEQLEVMTRELALERNTIARMKEEREAEREAVKVEKCNLIASIDRLQNEFTSLLNQASQERSDCLETLASADRTNSSLQKELVSLRSDKKALLIVKKDLEVALKDTKVSTEESRLSYEAEISRVKRECDEEVHQAETDLERVQTELRDTRCLVDRCERDQRVAEDERTAETVRCEAIMLRMQTECQETVEEMRVELEETRKSLAHEVIELNSRLEEALAKSETLSGDLEEVRGRAECEVQDRYRLETEVEQMARELRRAEKERTEAVEECQRHWSDQLSELNRRLESESMELARVKADREDIVHLYKGSKAKLEERLERLQAQLVAVERRSGEQKKALLKDLEDQRQIAGQFRTAYEGQIDQLRQELTEASTRSECQMEPLKLEIQQLKDEQANVCRSDQAKREVLNNELSRLRSDFSAAQTLHKTVVESRDKLQADLDNALSDLEDLRSRETAWKEERKSARGEMEEIRGQVESLVAMEEEWESERRQWFEEKDQLTERLDLAMRQLSGEELATQVSCGVTTQTEETLEDHDDRNHYSHNEGTRIHQMERQIADLELQLSTASAQCTQLSELVAALEAERKDWKQTVHHQKRSTETREWNEANKRAETAEASVQELRNRLEKERGFWLDKAREQEEKNRSQSKDVESKISSLKSKVQSLEEDKARLESQTKEWRIEWEEADEMRTSLDKEMRRMKAVLETKTSELTHIVAKLQTEQSSKERLRHEVTDLEERLVTTKRLEQDTANQLMSLKVKLAGLEAKELVHRGIRERMIRSSSSERTPPHQYSHRANHRTHINDWPLNRANDMHTTDDSLYTPKFSERKYMTDISDQSPKFPESNGRQNVKVDKSDRSDGETYALSTIQQSNGSLRHSRSKESNSIMSKRVEDSSNGCKRLIKERACKQNQDMTEFERIRELQRRNKAQPVHMRTSYPVETQACNPRELAEKLYTVPTSALRGSSLTRAYPRSSKCEVTESEEEEDNGVSLCELSVSEQLIKGHQVTEGRRQTEISARDSTLRSSLRMPSSSRGVNDQRTKTPYHRDPACESNIPLDTTGPGKKRENSSRLDHDSNHVHLVAAKRIKSSGASRTNEDTGRNKRINLPANKVTEILLRKEIATKNLNDFSASKSDTIARSDATSRCNLVRLLQKRCSKARQLLDDHSNFHEKSKVKISSKECSKSTKIRVDEDISYIPSSLETDCNPPPDLLTNNYGGNSLEQDRRSNVKPLHTECHDSRVLSDANAKKYYDEKKSRIVDGKYFNSVHRPVQHTPKTIQHLAVLKGKEE